MINLIEVLRGTGKKEVFFVHAMYLIELSKRSFAILMVLEHAPCSVGILVDCGFGRTSHIATSNVNSLMTVLFFGGNDDHEALAYEARMAEHPRINLIIFIVVRFLLNPVGPVTPIHHRQDP
nr:cation/H(+) antiporter 18-like [Tanacetum cinerariifolium]